MNIFISHTMKNLISEKDYDDWIGNMGSAHCGAIDDPDWIEFLHEAVDEWIECAKNYGDLFDKGDEIIIQICGVHQHEKKKGEEDE